MGAVAIILLLAGYLYFAARICRKAAKPNGSDSKSDPNTKPEDHDNPTDPATVKDTPHADIIGASSLNLDEFRKIFREEIREAVPLIVNELGTPADAGWADDENRDVRTYHKVVANKDLDNVFSHKTVSELSEENPLPAEPMADGIDFKQMDITMRVLKGKSERPEDIETTRKVLSKAGDADIFEVVKLDPVIKKRILMIECRIPNDSEADTPIHTEKENRPAVKKIVYHADINTEGIDAVDFNIYH